MTTAYVRPARPSTTIPKRFLGPRAGARNPDNFSGHLYQLSAERALNVGDYVVVDGPHDTFGVVLRAEHKESAEPHERYLHLIRGIRRKVDHTPVMHWQ